MRNASRLAVTLALLLAAAPALATNGMRMIGFGPVQNSMGGVGVGATLDANAVLTNPAGLPDLGNRLDVGASWFQPTVNYKATESQLPPTLTGAVVANPGADQKSKRGASIIPAVAANFAVTPDVAVGLGLTGVAGMGVDFPVNLYGGRTMSSYSQARLAPGIGWKLASFLSVGATANLMMAQMKWDVASGLGQVGHDTATSWGWGLTLAVQVKPSDVLTVGLAYETKSAFRQFTFNVPAHNAVNPATFASVAVPGGFDYLRFDQPPVMTVGVSYTPWEALLVAADLEYILWAETNGNGQPTYTSDTSLTGSMPWNLNWGNQWVFKVGAQYKAGRGFTVRAGYNYGKNPLDPTRAFENIAFPAIAEHHISVGATYDIRPFLAVSAGLTYAPEVKLSGNNQAYPAQGGQAIASYTSRMSQVDVDLGLTYKF